MDSTNPIQVDWNLHSPLQEAWHRREFETPRTMIVDEISPNNSAPNLTASDSDIFCCRSVHIVKLHGSCFDTSKYFDSNAATAEPDRTFSGSTSSTLPGDKPYWICTKCRRPTQGAKHGFAHVNHLTFYCCDACWKQIRAQLWMGLTFRMIQIHLCFTTLWISSPQGVFLAQRSTHYGEWVATVVLLVITLLFQIASFINALVIRPVGFLKRQQRMHPILDLWLEAKCALAWIVIIALMVHDGIRQYGSHFNGGLTALIACAAVMLLSYLFTTIVAWSNLIRGVTAVAAGYPYVFAERPRKVNICQALAYLS